MFVVLFQWNGAKWDKTPQCWMKKDPVTADTKNDTSRCLLVWGRRSTTPGPVKWQMSVKERDDNLNELLSLVKEFSMVLPGYPDDTGDSHRRPSELFPVGLPSQATLMQKDFFLLQVLRPVDCLAGSIGTKHSSHLSWTASSCFLFAWNQLNNQPEWKQVLLWYISVKRESGIQLEQVQNIVFYRVIECVVDCSAVSQSQKFIDSFFFNLSLLLPSSANLPEPWHCATVSVLSCQLKLCPANRTHTLSAHLSFSWIWA